MAATSKPLSFEEEMVLAVQISVFDLTSRSIRQRIRIDKLLQLHVVQTFVVIKDANIFCSMLLCVLMTRPLALGCGNLCFQNRACTA